MIKKNYKPRELHKTETRKFENIYKDKTLRDTGGALANYFMKRSHVFLEKTLPIKYDRPKILELEEVADI